MHLFKEERGGNGQERTEKKETRWRNRQEQTGEAEKEKKKHDRKETAQAHSNIKNSMRLLWTVFPG